jgi:hypothetical protein
MRLNDMGARRSVVAATAAALVVLAGCGGGDGDAVRPSTAPTTSTAPVGTADWVDSLPIGPPPRIGYVVGHTFHAVDGRIVRLPQDRGITSITRLGEGFLVTDDRYFEGSRGVFALRPDGAVVGDGAAASGPPVLASGGGEVYWMTFTPPESGLSVPTMLHRADVATGTRTAMRIEHHPGWLATAVGVIDDEVVYDIGFLGHGTVWATRFGDEPRRLGAVLGAVAVHGRSGLIAGIADQDGRIGVVVDHRTAAVLWEEQGVVPISFSPSGRRLLARVGTSVSIVDARSGRLVSPVSEAYGGKAWELEKPAWEDEHHLLAGVVLKRRAAVVRVDVRTGAWELAIDWTPLEKTFEVAFAIVR